MNVCPFSGREYKTEVVDKLIVESGGFHSDKPEKCIKFTYGKKVRKGVGAPLDKRNGKLNKFTFNLPIFTRGVLRQED